MPAEDDAPSAIARVRTLRSDGSGARAENVVVEEPLEIRVRRGTTESTLAVTMRTPGSDLELAAGFLWGEGIVRSPDQLIGVEACADRTLSARQRANVVIASLSPSAADAARNMERRFTISSACGVCGSGSLSDLHERGTTRVAPIRFDSASLAAMTGLLDGRQEIFARTGGLHAAALVDPDGALQFLREDVGRHNAVDKVVGAALVAGKLPLSGWTLVVSGRVGYEIAQKAVVAGISALVGVSAPTSLSVELAREFGLTLLAFARAGVANQYAPVDDDPADDEQDDGEAT
jgi:FdhD protein